MSFLQAPAAAGTGDCGTKSGATRTRERRKIRPWHCLLALLTLLCGPALPATASTVLTDDAPRVPLGNAVEYAIDVDHAYTIDSFTKPGPAIEFQPSTRATPSFGFTSAALWFRVRVRNASSLHKWLLHVEYPLLTSINIYQVTPEAVTETVLAGPGAERGNTGLALRRLSADIALEPGTETTLYIRTHTESSHLAPMSLWQPAAFVEHMVFVRLMFGLYYGIILAMLAYNLMLYLSVRDTAYLYYVGYIFSFGLLLFSINGLASEYVWSAGSWWGRHVRPLSIALASGVAIQFTRILLDTRWRLPRGDRFLRALIWICVALAAASLAGSYAVAIQLSAAVGLVVALGLFACGLAGWRAGVPTAFYFLLAWSVFLLGCMSYALMAFGILPSVFVTQHAIQIGSAMEVLLLSFALAYRIKLLREENERMQLQAKENLEARVAERTLELNEALEELSTVNHQMALLSEADKLTGAKNRHYFDSNYEAEWHSAARGQYSIALLLMDIDHFKRINDNYGHVFGDEVLAAVAGAIRAALSRSMDELVRYGGEEFIIMLPHTDLSGASDVGSRVKASVDALRLDCAGEAFTVAISMGIAAGVPSLEQQPSDLIEQADQALYKAKAGGRNRIVVHAEQHSPLTEAAGSPSNI